jgi:hypothetical protein
MILHGEAIGRRQAVTKMVAIGTRSEPECDPNYSGERAA